jgi:NTE family protein
MMKKWTKSTHHSLSFFVLFIEICYIFIRRNEGVSMFNKDKIGLALSGGGIRAFAQIPIIGLLQSENVSIDVISGTSMGSVIGSIVACGANADKLEEIMLELEKYYIDNQIFFRPSLKVLPFAKERLDGFVEGNDMEELLDSYYKTFDVEMITDVKIPIAINAVDLNSGKIVIFTSHARLFNKRLDWIIIDDVKLSTAVRASCSLPLVFSTKKYKDLKLVDGGILMNMPIPPCKEMDADHVISVSMVDKLPTIVNDSMISVMMRSLEIFAHSNQQLNIRKGDYNYNVPTSQYNMLDVGKGKEIIELSREHLNNKKSELLKTIKKWQNPMKFLK